MTLKWNRESFLVTLVVVMLLIGIGFYGYRYLVEPAKTTAENSTQIILEQENLLVSYPPETHLLEELQNKYLETTDYILDEEAINQTLVMLENTALTHSVSLLQLSRINDRQSIEGLSGEYVKTEYQVHVDSSNLENIRGLIRSLMSEDRKLSISSLSIQKNGDSNYSGLFTLELIYRDVD